jgi:glutaredoxin-related protein
MKKSLINIIAGTLIGASSLLYSCKQNEDVTYYEKDNLKYELIETSKTKQLNVYSTKEKDSAGYLIAYDQNKDGILDDFMLRHKSNSQIENMTFDSLDRIYKTINTIQQKRKADEEFKKNYPEFKKFWKEHFLVPFDTLVKSTGGMYALTDISKNGVDYDIVQFIGSMPGAYGIEISSDYRDEFDKTKGILLVPYGTPVHEVERNELNKTIALIMEK